MTGIPTTSIISIGNGTASHDACHRRETLVILYSIFLCNWLATKNQPWYSEEHQTYSGLLPPFCGSGEFSYMTRLNSMIDEIMGAHTVYCALTSHPCWCVSEYFHMLTCDRRFRGFPAPTLSSAPSAFGPASLIPSFRVSCTALAPSPLDHWHAD